MIKGVYSNYEEIGVSFKYQQRPDTCWPTSIWNILNEFWNREMKKITNKDTPLSIKDISSSLYGKGPYGTFPLKNYKRIINQKIEGQGIIIEEKINSSSTFPLDITPKDMIVDLEMMLRIIRNPDCSFPIISVDNGWFGHFGLKSWSDPDMTHVITILDYDREEDIIQFFDPAGNFYKRSSKGLDIPKFINGDQLMSFWDSEINYPRWISWFRKKDMPLEAWLR
ncbi:MAG: hypothetical protein JXA22_09025 [Candidatus Thermoplasmatota archaeon]|nr:hypothetical protein [Candidatus Thermoplasmatota archaeon]